MSNETKNKCVLGWSIAKLVHPHEDYCFDCGRFLERFTNNVAGERSLCICGGANYKSVIRIGELTAAELHEMRLAAFEYVSSGKKARIWTWQEIQQMSESA